MPTTTIQPGVVLTPAYLDRPRQEQLLAEVRTVLQAAPLYTPRMPNSGKPMSVQMSNCGPLGWVTDEAGYRYQPTHPDTGAPWPAIPARSHRCSTARAPISLALARVLGSASTSRAPTRHATRSSSCCASSRAHCRSS